MDAFTANPLPNTGVYNWDTTALPDGSYMLEAATQNSYALFDSDASKGFQIKNYVVSPTNHEPLKPNKPTGQTNGKQGQEYTYSSSTTDSDGDQLYYWFEWGDGNNSGWLGPYNSGVTCETKHTWKEKNIYIIKVKAKDI